MVIRWNRIFGLLLAVVLLVLLLRGENPMAGLFEGLADTGGGNRGQVERVATLGLLCITVVAIVKLLSQRSGK